MISDAKTVINIYNVGLRYEVIILSLKLYISGVCCEEWIKNNVTTSVYLIKSKDFHHE